MNVYLLFAVSGAMLFLTFVAWRRYLWASEIDPHGRTDRCPYSLTEIFGDDHLVNVPHQAGVSWLSEIFSRSAKRFPDLPALQIPKSGESLTFSELENRANSIARALSPYLTGPDQVVAVSMPQDNWQVVAAHLGVLKAGGTLMFLDESLPENLVSHMLKDADPVVVLTRGVDRFRELPAVDVMTLPQSADPVDLPPWLDDPNERLAAIFYTSGTTGIPKGVECTHAGYINLVLSYADYFDLVPGVDATSLISSLGYDGCISELYSAWVSGCAVVLLTHDQVRSGPDLLPILRGAEVTVLFCSPALLPTLTNKPELDLPYPICRYIVPAGEQFPATLVEPWTRGRRQLINTYGPTEASTDTSRQSLRPGEVVTIGTPFANVSYVILDFDDLRPLPHGEIGELCIGGVHVARGYRNRPEETRKRFILHPQFGRLYRTGDRCRIDPQTHRVHFLGRLDTQLKVRGHRVEVQAVEDLLQSRFPEIESAVLDYQNQELVAFVVAPGLNDEALGRVSPAPVAWSARVLDALHKELPAPSIPSRIFMVDHLTLQPISGKIDRHQLPRASQVWSETVHMPEKKFTDEPRTSAPPGEGLERNLGDVLAMCETVFGSPLAHDDVFADCGGHSIVMAQLAHRLQLAGWTISVRELFVDYDTPRKVASRPRTTKRASVEPSAHSNRSSTNRDEQAARVLSVGLFTIFQLLFLLLLFFPHLTVFLTAVSYLEIGEFFMAANLMGFIGVGLVIYLIALCLPFANLLWTMLLRCLMGGHNQWNRVVPGFYPKWSRMHLRIWCLQRMERMVLVPLGTLLRSAPLTSFVLRGLGAKVGNNLQCAQDVDFAGPLCLLTIADNVSIQSGAYVHLTRWSGQELQVGTTHLGNGCKIGTRAAVSCDISIGRGSWIQPFVPILNDVGNGEMWEGAPARFAGRCIDLKRTAAIRSPVSRTWWLESINILMQVALDFLLLTLPAVIIAWYSRGFMISGDGIITQDYFKLAPLAEITWEMTLYAFTTSWLAVVTASLATCLFIRFTAFSPGLFPVRGLKAALLLYRMKKMNQIQSLWTWTITGQYLRALSGVRFARIGASECDLMWNFIPETTSADSRVFWSNGSFTNMVDLDVRGVTLRQLDMPLNFFAGNNCVAESGHFPTNFLLGVSTPGDDTRFRRQMLSRSGEPKSVAGNPPIEFASADFEAENRTHRSPSFGLFFSRVFLNDLVGIGMLPIARVAIYVALFVALTRMGGQVLATAFLSLILSEVILVLASITIKHLLVGKWGADDSTPFWSGRHFCYFFAQDCFFAWCSGSLGLLAGTLLPNPILRAMGCEIGQKTILTAPMQASDWNAVRFGGNCIISGFLQFHTLENMMLRVKQSGVDDGSVVDFGATVMGGATIEAGSTITPLSLVLKEMHLTPDVYHGSPAEPYHCPVD